MVRGARRCAAALMVMALGVAACGGDDDGAEGAGDDVGTEAAEEPEATGDEPGDENTGGAEDEPAEVEATEPPADDEPADDGGDGGSGNINSINDIPERCRDLMADFLQEIEPIVEPIDWENGTLSDFEAIAADFEALADEFETESVDEACDDLDIEDEAGFELIIEFAADVAPGTVPFFEFLDSMASGVMPDDGGDAGDGGSAVPGAEGFEDCDDAIAAIQEWIVTYDSMTEMPVSELSKFASMGTVIMTCTPEQLQFFDSQEVADFLGG